MGHLQHHWFFSGSQCSHRTHSPHHLLRPLQHIRVRLETHLGIRTRQRTTFLRLLLLRRSTLHFLCRIWLMTLGASHTQTPRKRASPCWNHRNMSLSHLHRQRDCLQCAHLTSSPRAARIVLLPDFFHPPAQNQRPASTLWAVQARFCRYTRQHVRAVLPGLRGILDAVPSDFASHTRQHELRGTHFWCGCDWGFGSLVCQWA